jgi:hypothetical protein
VISFRTRSTRISPPPPGSEPGPREALEHLADGAFGDLREVVDLGGREAVDVDLREAGLDVPEKFLVPLERERGMEATLEEDLISADGDHLRDLVHQHFPVEDIALGMLRRPVESAEITHRRADVGVVDVAVDVVGPPRLRVEPRGDGVRCPPDRGEVRRAEQQDGIRCRKSPASDGVFKDAVDARRHDVRSAGEWTPSM